MARNSFMTPPAACGHRVGSVWSRLIRVTRLTWGGLLIGAFLGVYLGAVLGLVYAGWADDVSAALDGAVLGGAALACIGALYGCTLGLTEHPVHAEFGGAPSRLDWADLQSVHSRQAPPAGRLGPPDSPEMEHAHGR